MTDISRSPSAVAVRGARELDLRAVLGTLADEELVDLRVLILVVDLKAALALADRRRRQLQTRRRASL
jgi:hypothetical protein